MASAGVGAITLGFGVALTLAPERVGSILGMGDDATVNRLVGLSDLALAPGLLLASKRWPWMTARAALNVAVGAQFARMGARQTAALMGALTVTDSSLAAALHRAER